MTHSPVPAREGRRLPPRRRVSRGTLRVLGAWLLFAAASVPFAGSADAPAVNATAVNATAVDAVPAAADLTPELGSTPDDAPDPENRARPPTASDDLEDRARHLFTAIVDHDPKRADDFFFPRAPFIPLKDVSDPGRYFDQLLATFHRDISALHGTRNNWSGATFVSFALGSEPRWVAPGKEYNKIGYYRTFHGKLRYRFEADGGSSSRILELDVGTIISWGGRWYVTHLAPIHH